MTNSPKNQPDLNGATIVELAIGSYAKLNEAARVPYSWGQPWLGLGRGPDGAAALLEGVVLQLMQALRPGACRLALYDESAGAQWAALRHVIVATAASTQPVGETWPTAREALTRLRALEELLLRRASLLAGAQLTDIQTYNQGRRAPEAVWLVVLGGLAHLVAQDADIVHSLQRLALRGPALGVVLVLHHDVQAARERALGAAQSRMLYETLARWAPQCMGINLCAQPPHLLGVSEPYLRFLQDFGFVPRTAAEQPQAWAQAVLTMHQQGRQERAEQDTVSVRLGESQARPAYWGLGAATKAYHALISGGSGSGKTTVVQHLILSICEQYQPQNVQLVLVDYGAVSFAPYRGLAHVLAVYDQIDDGPQLGHLLHWINDELQRRKGLFRTCGLAQRQTIDNLTSYSAATGDELPSILVIFDEFGSLMADINVRQCSGPHGPRYVRLMAEDTLNLLAREGRKVGMHAVLVTQSFAKVDRMPQDIKSNPLIALGLKAETPSDSRALLCSENDSAWALSERQAVRNAASGQVRGNVIIDLDDISKDQIAQRQADLQARWSRVEPSPLEVYLEACASPEARALDLREERSTPTVASPEWLRPASA